LDNFDTSAVANRLGLSHPDFQDLVTKLNHFTSTLNPGQQAALGKAFSQLHERLRPATQPEIQSFLDSNVVTHKQPIVMGLFIAVGQSPSGH